VQDLLARMLVTGIARQMRQGLNRDYEARSAAIAGLKGRLS
jgi:5-methylcytosine-specific restriction endonuclease McrBC regulatory subunit McrC